MHGWTRQLILDQRCVFGFRLLVGLATQLIECCKHDAVGTAVVCCVNCTSLGRTTSASVGVLYLALLEQ